MPPDTKLDPATFYECIHSLANSRALCFELLGHAEGVAIRLAGRADEASWVLSQLRAFCPAATIRDRKSHCANSGFARMASQRRSNLAWQTSSCCRCECREQGQIHSRLSWEHSLLIHPVDSVVRLAAAFGQFGAPGHNSLIPPATSYPTNLVESIIDRATRRSGMLLSLTELASIVRLPSEYLRTPALLREPQMLKRLPAVALSVVESVDVGAVRLVGQCDQKLRAPAGVDREGAGIPANALYRAL